MSEKGHIPGHVPGYVLVNALPGNTRRGHSIESDRGCNSQIFRSWSSTPSSRTRCASGRFLVQRVEGRPDSLRLLARPAIFELTTSAFGLQRVYSSEEIGGTRTRSKPVTRVPLLIWRKIGDGKRSSWPISYKQLI